MKPKNSSTLLGIEPADAHYIYRLAILLLITVGMLAGTVGAKDNETRDSEPWACAHSIATLRALDADSKRVLISSMDPVPWIEIQRFTGIESINIFGCSLDPGVFDNIVRRKTLISLKVSFSKGVFTFDKPPGIVGGALKTLNLVHSGIADQLLDRLVRHSPELEHLDLSGNWHLTDGCLANIGKLKQLRVLKLGSCYKMTGQFLAKAATLEHLETLDVSMMLSLDSKSLSILISAGRLKEIYAGAAKDLRSALRHIDRCTSLLKLDASDGNLDDSVFQRLGKCEKLQWLNLAGNPELGGAEENQYPLLASLVHLDLSRTAMNRSALRGLLGKSMVIETLLLDDCADLGDAAAKDLVRCKNLKSISVERTDLTSLALKDFGRLEKLRHLDVRGCSRIRQEAVDVLRQRRRSLQVYFKPWR